MRRATEQWKLINYRAIIKDVLKRGNKESRREASKKKTIINSCRCRARKFVVENHPTNGAKRLADARRGNREEGGVKVAFLPLPL